MTRAFAKSQVCALILPWSAPAPTGKRAYHPSEHHVISRDDPESTTIEVTTRCPICAGSSRVIVPREGYLRWINGEPFGRHLRDLDATARELLLTGIDERCWAQIFADGTEGAERLIDSLSGGLTRRMGEIRSIRTQEVPVDRETEDE